MIFPQLEISDVSDEKKCCLQKQTAQGSVRFFRGVRANGNGNRRLVGLVLNFNCPSTVGLIFSGLDLFDFSSKYRKAKPKMRDDGILDHDYFVRVFLHVLPQLLVLRQRQGVVCGM